MRIWGCFGHPPPEGSLRLPDAVVVLEAHVSPEEHAVHGGCDPKVVCLHQNHTSFVSETHPERWKRAENTPWRGRATRLGEPNSTRVQEAPAFRAVPYLVVPWLVCQHFHALESRCFTPGSEGCSLREELHVDALAQVNEGQAVAEPVDVTRVVVQEPSTTRSNPLSIPRLPCGDTWGQQEALAFLPG